MSEQLTEDAVFRIAFGIESPDLREEYLRQVSLGDTALYDRVKALLAASREEPDFLESPATGAGATIDIAACAESAGSQIGPYKIRELIGEGGFGAVYVAEQHKPVSRKVALKIIKPGMDSRNIIARFESERQALALMDHPNIAKVLDAGATETGRPYFAMELVHGVPITDFADDQKLSTHQRLELFVEVCRAVQHAHQKGIIHRDLKPSNIMVTMHDDRPVPKVIDFGVAKALSHKLTDNTVYTAYGQMVGTPLYMSPEQTQMSGLDVDTRSDVYSLGVLLYELLTGTTPFDREALKRAEFDEMRRMIREDEPPRPSARLSTLDAESLSTLSSRRQVDPRKLSQLCRGELDWIVMKALEKDRTRRYETANDLAADIHRYLNDEPVEACPPTTAYQFSKFARRNKASLATLLLVTAALVVGILGTTWQALRANHQRDLAFLAERRSRNDQRAAEEAKEAAEQARELESNLRRQTESLLTSSYVDRAQALCEQGEIGRGILWYAHSLHTAPEEATDLERVIRRNLAAWRGELHSLTTLVQHGSEARAVAFSPDDSRILTGCSDGTVWLREVATGRPIGDPLRHPGAVLSVAFSPDGSRILTGGDDGTARLWDVETRMPIGEPLRHHPPAAAATENHAVRFVAFSPDGSRLATASGAWFGLVGAVHLWDVATLQAIGQPLERGKPQAIRFCPAGLRAVVTSERGKHQLWDVDRSTPIGPPVLHVGIKARPRIAAAISPDGSTFATANHPTTSIQLWDSATGKQVLPPMLREGEILALAFSPDGGQILSAGNMQAARLWDAATGRPIGTPLRQQSLIRAVAFSSDGTRILTGGPDGAVRLWKVASESSRGRVIQHQDRLVGAAFSPDGLRILTERDGRLQLRDGTSGEAVGRDSPLLRDDIMRMNFSPDGSRFLLLPPWHAELRDVASGNGQPIPSPSIHDATFSPDGSRILAGYGRGVAVLFDANTTQPIGEPMRHAGAVTGLNAAVNRVAFTPDGSRILTGGHDGRARLWDATTFESIGEPHIHQSEFTALAYSPDGAQLLTGFGDGTARLWDSTTWEAIGPPLHHREFVHSAVFSPDGSRFLTSSVDRQVRLWDTATLKPIGPAMQFGTQRAYASFRRDGRQLMAAGGGTARVWETPPGRLEGDPERIVLWAQVITGLELDASGGIGGLDSPTWEKLHRQLQQKGGPPR